MRVVAISLLCLTAAAAAHAETLACSPNGRFCIERGQTTEGPDADEKGNLKPRFRYRFTDHGNGPPRLIREVLFNGYHDQQFASDDGRFFVFAATNDRREGKISIFRADGSVVKELPLHELITANDLQFDHERPRWFVRGEGLIVSVPATVEKGPNALHGEIEIDLERGELLTPLRDIYPPPRALARADVPGDPGIGKAEWRTPSCKRLAENATPVTSSLLLQMVTERVSPEYPEVAVKARISGTVPVDIVVDSEGKVVCQRIKPFPFGIDDQVEKTMEKWRFEPSAESAFRVGRLVIEFRRFEHKEWQALTGTPMPTGLR